MTFSTNVAPAQEEEFNDENELTWSIAMMTMTPQDEESSNNDKEDMPPLLRR